MSHLATLPRYQALAAARERILTGAARRVPAAAMASQARAMGLWGGKEPIFGHDAQLGLLLDLAVFAPVGDHTPALEREVRASAPPEGSEHAEVLAAAQQARFTLFHLGAPAPQGGIHAMDILRGTPLLLWDAVLEREEFQGCAFAGRLMQLGEAEMTCGATAPVTDDVLQILLGFPVPEAPAPSHLPALTPPSDEDLASLREQAKQPDFTVRLYRAALNLGLLGPLPKR